VSDAPVIDVRDLGKVYRTPFRRRRSQALNGVSFSVGRGEIFGFLGPNGAGKTTTIRVLMGLIAATAGSARIFGHPVPSREARMRLGFLPEQPYFYDYLTVEELLDLVGRLFGLDRATRTRRAGELIERVGLGRARGQSLKRFSKGMMQRAGLAQALMNDPDLVVLDEPMSGLDPIGRKEVRDLIVELRERGKTVFFSSHILTDVEAVADRVAIVARGEIRAQGAPAELVARTLLGTDLVLRLPADPDAANRAILALGSRAHTLGPGSGQALVPLGPLDDIDEWLATAHAAGAKVVAVTPRHATLEDLFLRQTAGAAPAGAAAADAPRAGGPH
jgi:ABC-2 type transport system ATP-binding protein